VWVASADGEGVFLIQSFDCKYSLCAGTDKAKQEWFNALFTTIEKLFKVRRQSFTFLKLITGQTLPP
jgi:hypothetical protein